MLKLFCALVALSVVVLPAGADEGGAISEADGVDRDGMRLLFIGNSLTYSNDMPEMLRSMLVESGVAVGRIEVVAFPAVGLQDHWEGGPARSRIAEGGWDVVVMQQGPSATEGRPSLLDYAQRFGGVIREVGATPALFMVWPAASRRFDFDGVSESYMMAAARADGLLFPVGEAWRSAWRARPELKFYGPDGFHPSSLGSYLAALVIFDQLTEVDLSSLPAVVPTESGHLSIPEDLAAVLHRAATDANQALAHATSPR